MRALKIAGAAIAAVVVVIALLLVIGIPSGFLTAADPGAGRARDRLQARHQWRRQDRPVAVAQHHAERRHAAGSEGPRHQPPLHRRQHPGRRDARQPVGRQAADHRTRHHPPGGERAAAARARQGRQSRRRGPPPASRGDAFSIEHISVTGGTVVFSNLRDRVENRIETINADIAIDADRKIDADRQRPPQRLSAEIRDQGGAAGRRRSSGRTSRPRSRSTRPDLLQAPLSAKAEARLNGAVVMINGVTGALGDGAFNGWASVDLSSKPLVKLDLDFQQLAIAATRSTGNTVDGQPWSNATIDINGLNYIDAAGAHFRGRTQHRRRALHAGRDRRHAGQRRAEGAGFQSRRL